MSKETTVFLLGILLIVLPFLGLPELWKQYAVSAIGALLVIIGYLLRLALYLKRIDRGNGERGTDAFVETADSLLEDNSSQSNT